MLGSDSIVINTFAVKQTWDQNFLIPFNPTLFSVFI